jgi:hypothetical protein
MEWGRALYAASARTLDGVMKEHRHVHQIHSGRQDRVDGAIRTGGISGGPTDAGRCIVTIFRGSDNPSPPEIKGLSGNMGRMMSKHENLLSPAAMEDSSGKSIGAWAPRDWMPRPFWMTFASKAAARIFVPLGRGKVSHDRERHGAGDCPGRRQSPQRVKMLGIEKSSPARFRATSRSTACRCRRRCGRGSWPAVM